MSTTLEQILQTARREHELNCAVSGYYSSLGPVIAERMAMLENLSRLNLPVGTVKEMKRESCPDPKRLVAPL